MEDTFADIYLIPGHLRFLPFTDLYGLDTDILITFLSVLGQVQKKMAPKRDIRVKR